MKRSYSALSLLLVFAFLTAGGQVQKAAQPPDSSGAAEAIIRALSQEWSKAAAAKDLEKAVSVYADDAPCPQQAYRSPSESTRFGRNGNDTWRCPVQASVGLQRK